MEFRVPRHLWHWEKTQSHFIAPDKMVPEQELVDWLTENKVKCRLYAHSDPDEYRMGRNSILDCIHAMIDIPNKDHALMFKLRFGGA